MMFPHARSFMRRRISIHFIRALAILLPTAVLSSSCRANEPNRIDVLPEVMVLADGTRVKTRADWRKRRGEMIEILQHWQYGHMPPVPAVRAENVRTEQVTVEGLNVPATRIMAELVFGPDDALRMTAGCWLPGRLEKSVPTILAIEPVWWSGPFIQNGIVKRVLSRGYAFAGFDHNALASYEDPNVRAANDAYPQFDWGAVAVAAWGCSVTMNWLETLSGIDAQHVAVWGHSRRGKSALLAGALDERFAAVAPHQSGMAGSALYRVRGKGAQELEQLLERYWLIPRAFTFIDREETMPFDQHWLLALTAPRATYIYVGAEDTWGNPPGERAAFDAAKPIYEWLGHPDRLAIEVINAGHVDANAPEGAFGWDALIDFLDGQWTDDLSSRSFFQSLP